MSYNTGWTVDQIIEHNAKIRKALREAGLYPVWSKLCSAETSLRHKVLGNGLDCSDEMELVRNAKKQLEELALSNDGCRRCKPCEKCEGTGRIRHAPDEVDPCGDCKGKGFVNK